MKWDRVVRMPRWLELLVLSGCVMVLVVLLAWPFAASLSRVSPGRQALEAMRAEGIDDGVAESLPERQRSAPGEETPEIPAPSIPLEAPGGERSPSPRQSLPRQPSEPPWPLWNHPACPCDGPANEGTGTLRVNSPSTWVEILVDGESRGGSPTSFHMPADEYAIELRLRGERQRRWRHRVRLCGDSVCNLSITFKP